MANKGEKLVSAKYEPDTPKSYGSEVQDSVTQNLMATLLKGGLAESIKTIVASETAKALKQFQSKSGEYVSTSKTSRIGGEILEPFDPDTKDCNIVKWLNVIDQLGEIHGWSEYERAFFMQAKLQGRARSWYNSIDNYDLSWEHWRVVLQQAFPGELDFAQLLKEMLARVKTESETMAQYYHSKLELIKKCDITGTKAISCLIDGLPENIKVNARTFQCTNVGELYTGFLSSLDRFEEFFTSNCSGDLKRRNARITTYSTQSKMLKKEDSKPVNVSKGIRCFNCQEYGTHISKNCPKAKAERCMICGDIGHNRFACQSRGTSTFEGKAMKRNTYQDGRM